MQNTTKNVSADNNAVLENDPSNLGNSSNSVNPLVQKAVSSAIDEIPKAFESSKSESEIYNLWEKTDIFNPDKFEQYLLDNKRPVNKPFVMTLPPPNANGDLHIGHMCGYSCMDLMGRYFRMRNRPVLLLAGKDHAGIQTEAVFTKKLEKEGISKWDLGREEFYKRCYKFCIESANNARTQEKAIGLSADWSREKFTLDPALTKVIYKTFYKMLEEGMIYRSKRIINQCPNCKTALADIDTDHEEMPGIFAYIIYPFVLDEDNDKAEKAWGHRGIVVATTRPETMLGDTAVAVHPDDKRYAQFVGHQVKLPFVDRKIPIIADEALDMELGTGALKVTPAHSPIDFELGIKHNLVVVNVINPDAKMEGPIPERFVGLGTIECSKALVKELDEMGLLVKIERIKHEVAVCERCHTPVEPIISLQWYLDVKEPAKQALEALKKGQVKVHPEGQQRALEYFYENIQPWCISRQLWWGHKIPVWYSGGKYLHDWLLSNPDKNIGEFEKITGKKLTGTGKIFVGEEMPVEDKEWQGDKNDLSFEAETDVFDTWFSSGQWPFSTLGGPEGEDYAKYYPTDVMVHGRDILFWWTARMIMMGLYRTDKVPYHDVYLTGMILAPDGSKMSKSKGNTIPPAEIISKYGADAVRMWYYTDALAGANVPLREEKIKGNRNFVNKIWNANRFVLMNVDDSEVNPIKTKLSELQKTWNETEMEESTDQKDVFIKSALAETKYSIDRASKHIEMYRFNLGAEEIREFFWHRICDCWIEEVKIAISTRPKGDQHRIVLLARLIFVMQQYYKIMHPFIPFITEAVWQALGKYGFTNDALISVEL